MSTGKTRGRLRTREHIHMQWVPTVISYHHILRVYDPFKFTLPSTPRSSSISFVPTCYSCFPFRESSLKLTLISRVVTLCTTTLKFPHFVPTIHLCILCESQSKWRLQGTIEEPSRSLYTGCTFYCDCEHCSSVAWKTASTGTSCDSSRAQKHHKWVIL